MLFRFFFFIAGFRMALAMGSTRGWRTKRMLTVSIGQVNKELEKMLTVADGEIAKVNSKIESECYWHVYETFGNAMYLRQQATPDIDVYYFDISRVSRSAELETLFEVSHNDDRLPAVSLNCPEFPNSFLYFLDGMNSLSQLEVAEIESMWSIEYSLSTGKMTFHIAGMQPRVILDSVKVLNNLMKSQPAYFEAGVWKTGIKRDAGGRVQFGGTEGPVKGLDKFGVPMVYGNTVAHIPCPQCGELEGPFATVYGAASIFFRRATFNYRPKKNYRGRRPSQKTNPVPLQKRKEQALEQWWNTDQEIEYVQTRQPPIFLNDRHCWVFKDNESAVVYSYDGAVLDVVDVRLDNVRIPDQFFMWRRICWSPPSQDGLEPHSDQEEENTERGRRFRNRMQPIVVNPIPVKKALAA